MSNHKNHDNYFVPGLFRGLRVLEILGDSGKPMTLTEIGNELSLSRSSTFRLVYTLRHMGFLKATADDRAFELGARVLNLGFSYLNQQGLVQIARPHLERLRDDTANSTHLSILEGRDVLYLESQQSKTAFTSNISTGTRSPAYATAQGWCLLTGLDDGEVGALFQDVELEPFTEHTPCTLEDLLRRINDVRKQRAVLSRGYYHAGGSSIVAPIVDRTGKSIAAIDISGPDIAFNFEKAEDFYIPRIQQCAKAISAELGFNG